MILNAGIMMCPYSLTKDGHEMQFGTNHLGHYLLTALLSHLLLQSECARHITVSSLGHRHAKEKQIEFDDIKSSEQTYNPQLRYGMSKLANVYFARGLAARWGARVKCYSLHPGIIKTELGRYMPCWMTACAPLLLCLMGWKLKSIPQGTATQVYAAVSDHVLRLPNGS